MSTLTTLRGIDVHFPFEPYECQNAYMEKVIDALNQEENAALESPTGTGKTLSLLCSSLAWLQNYKGRLNSSQAEQLALQVGAKEKGTRIAPQIIYASRTHSQLAQVVRELNKTTYKTLSVTTIASRDQLCINERVARETDNKVKAHMCRTLVGSHKCNYFNKWEKDHQITEELYKRGGKALDIEDLVSAATQYGHCPFYQSRSSRESADLILLPYNYILDPRLRNTHKIELKGNIVIFDEAHNLESVCEESTSVCFSSTDLAHCIAEAKEVLSNVMEDIETLREQKDNTTEGFGPVAKKSIEDEMNVQEIAHLIELLKRIEEEIDNLNLEPTKQEQKLELKGKLFKGEEMKKLLERAHYRPEMREPIALLIDRISQYLSKKAETGGAFSQTGKSLQEFSSFVSTVSADTFDDIQRLPDGTVVKQDDPTKSFYLYAEKDAETNKRKLNYWCFSAGVAMRFLQSRGVRSIIITSGTLSPLNHFISTMGIPFGITLENGHVAKPDQICAASLNVSLNMTSLNGCFQNRGTAEYKEGVGTVVLKTAQVAPQGVLVFFPSYTLMTEMLSCWKTPKRNAASSVYDQIGEAKKVFVEPRSKAALNAMFLEYDQEIRVNNGAVMFAVCRGKVSEGIDFADTHCRVVIIVGIPFPPLKDTRIVLKKYYLQEAVSQHRMKCLTPDQWYRTEGIRAINQAIGRIIRHKDDFGAVIMADPRFSKMDRREFPSWMRSTIKEYNSPMEYFSLMQRFFRDRGLACESALRRLRETYEDSLKEQKRKGDGLVAFRKRRAGQSSLDTEEDAAKRYANELMGLYQNARKLDEKEIDVVGCAIKYHERKSTKVSKLTLNEDFVGNTKNDRSAVKDLFKSIQPREAPKTGQLVAKRMIKLKSNSKVCDVNSPSTSKVALARNPSRAEATSSQTPTDIQFSSHSENRPPTTPSVSSIASKLPTISMEEYVLKIKSLSKETRKRFTDAQGVYLQTKNLRDFMELMGAAFLPQHTEIFKGIHCFLDEKHKKAFVRHCMDRNLL